MLETTAGRGPGLEAQELEAEAPDLWVQAPEVQGTEVHGLWVPEPEVHGRSVRGTEVRDREAQSQAETALTRELDALEVQNQREFILNTHSINTFIYWKLYKF